MEGASLGRRLEALVSSLPTTVFVICFTINYMEQINPTQSPDCGKPRLQEEMQQEVRLGPTPVNHNTKRQRQEDVV